MAYGPRKSGRKRRQRTKKRLRYNKTAASRTEAALGEVSFGNVRPRITTRPDKGMGRQWGEGLNKPKTQLWRVQLDVRSVLFADHRLPECRTRGCGVLLTTAGANLGEPFRLHFRLQHTSHNIHTHTQKFLRSKGFARTMKRRPRNCTSQGSKAPTKPCWYLRKLNFSFLLHQAVWTKLPQTI